jgi:WD40 repeat protein
VEPEEFAKQTSEFPITMMKFSPVNNFKLVSCGKENIRFWKVLRTGNIRGTSVILGHHSRESQFTSLDFEWGPASAQKYAHMTPDALDRTLQRFYVSSGHGTVFQINYQNESLEATYRITEKAIHSIAVNEDYCVTGDEDRYLRVWPLDFTDVFMGVQLDGVVCQVEISSCGLRIACGSYYGSLGILDKSWQKYHTLIRSHSDAILSMDFHVPTGRIITVSMDQTIKVWNLKDNDQAIEFTSPIEQPLCVAAHPRLDIFSCGFKTGKMRVFDINKTCVADEFKMFDRPLTKIKYSPKEDILVTVCEDGAVAIHNVTRQH